MNDKKIISKIKTGEQFFIEDLPCRFDNYGLYGDFVSHTGYRSISSLCDELSEKSIYAAAMKRYNQSRVMPFLVGPADCSEGGWRLIAYNDNTSRFGVRLPRWASDPMKRFFLEQVDCSCDIYNQIYYFPKGFTTQFVSDLVAPLLAPNTRLSSQKALVKALHLRLAYSTPIHAAKQQQMPF